MQARWHGERHVKVFDRRQFLEAGLQPFLLIEFLALRAMPIATRMVDVVFESALRTLIAMTAQCRSAALGDRLEYGQMPCGKLALPSSEVIRTELPDDLGECG